MAKKFLTGLNLVVLDTDPATGSEGELYFNSSASVAKIYQAGAWSVLGAGGGGTTVSTTEPPSPEIGDSWYKNDTGEFYVYDGTYWVEVNGVIDGSSGSLVNIDSITYPDYITFDTTPENTSEEVGTLSWDTDFETLKLQSNGLTLQIGQEHVIRVKNASGSTAIPEMSAVMFSGSTGDTITVSPAISTQSYEPELLVGITTEEIPADGFGFVTQFGFINKLDTDEPGLSLGDLLYVDPEIPGGLTNVKPLSPNWTFPIAAVTRVHATTGRILVRAIPGLHVRDLVDANITSESEDQVLRYNASASVWMNTAENVITAKNVNESTTINAFMPVYIDTETLGQSQILFDVALATGSVSNARMPADAITTASVAGGAFTKLVTHGVVRGLTIAGWSDGDVLYVAPEGGLTNVKPTGNNSIQPFARVLSVDNGTIYVIGNSFVSYIENLPNLETNKVWLGTSGRPVQTTLNTSFIAENTNLYFTDERAQDAAADLFTSGVHTGASVEYNDSTGKINITNTGVTALYGTANEIEVSSNTGGITVGIPNSPIFVTPNIGVATATSINGTNIPTSASLVVTADLSSYLTSASAASIYQPIGSYSTTSHNHTVDSLSNVVITGTPTDGQAIVWDTTTSKWVNETVVQDLSSYLTISSASSTYQPLNGALTTLSSTFGNNTIQNGIVKFANYGMGMVSWSLDTNTYLTSESDTLETVTDRGATSTNAITISNTTESTNSTTGALIISGGVGVSKDVWIDGNLHVAGTTTTENTKTVATHDNLIYLNAALDSTITNAVFSSGSITYTAENLYTAGMDIRITGVDPAGFNISTGDNLTVASATPTQFIVIKSDPGSSYVSGGIAHAKEEANPDLGFAGGYYSDGYAHAGLFRDASDGVFKFFQGYTPEPDEAVNIDTTHASFAFADIQIRNIKPQGSGQNDNFGIGYNAMNSASGFANFAIGQNAFSGGSGTNNFAFGDDSMENNTGGGNFAFGDSALTDNTGNYNYGIGYNALQNNSGWDNYSIGPALYGNTGDWNYAVGTNSLQSNTGDYNFAFGYQAGLNNTGSYNVYIGKSEGLSTSNNIIIADNEGNLRAQYLSASSGWTLGTVVSGTWNGSEIGYQYGGTGLTSLGTAGQVLTVNAGATAIEWATPSGGGGGPSTTTTSITVNTAVAIESFAIATSRTAEAIIQITQGTDYYSSKVLLIHDGTNVKITEYAILESTVGAIPVTVSSVISGSNVELRATITDAASTNATAKVVMTEVAV